MNSNGFVLYLDVVINPMRLGYQYCSISKEEVGVYFSLTMQMNTKLCWFRNYGTGMFAGTFYYFDCHSYFVYSNLYFYDKGLCFKVGKL